MKPVVQQDRTGCALASVAAITGASYLRIKKEAATLGIHVSDPKLWSDTQHVRRLLTHLGIDAGENEQPFVSWEMLPARALLAIKWHEEKAGPAWHWVVFARDTSGSYVLDPKKALRTNRRTDFGRMKPKWFIAITPQHRAR
jgi:ABC-type bacteriocin/lantibiotic exporter with double-glycine peptidase domain